MHCTLAHYAFALKGFNFFILVKVSFRISRHLKCFGRLPSGAGPQRQSQELKNKQNNLQGCQIQQDETLECMTGGEASTLIKWFAHLLCSTSPKFDSHQGHGLHCFLYIGSVSSSGPKQIYLHLKRGRNIALLPMSLGGIVPLCWCP